MAHLIRILPALALSSSWVAVAPPAIAQDGQNSPPVITDVAPPPADTVSSEPETEPAAPSTASDPSDAPATARPERTRVRETQSVPAVDASTRDKVDATEEPVSVRDNTIAELPSGVTPSPGVTTYNPPVTPPSVLPDPGEYRMMRALPWIVGVLILGVLAFFFLRGNRRRSEADGYEEESLAPTVPLAGTKAAASSPTQSTPEPKPAEPSILVRRVGARGVAGMSLGMTAAVATTRPKGATPASSSLPTIDMRIKPMRAGISQSDAIVEFELMVTNKGQISAEDVRISTWMFPAGTAIGSEMERSLIRPPAQVILSEVDPGDPKRVETSVSLPVERLKTDSVLPVVVAEARYRLADGREERSMVKYAVGVPVGGELAHFDVSNPTGLHDGVEARPLNG